MACSWTYRSVADGHSVRPVLGATSSSDVRAVAAGAVGVVAAVAAADVAVQLYAISYDAKCSY